MAVHRVLRGAGIAILVASLLPGDAFADWAFYEQTSIQKIAGKISHGYIFQTRSGSMYEVADFIYLYEYEYGASVTVLRDGPSYKLIIDGVDTPILCRKLTGPSPTAPAPAASAPVAPPPQDPVRPEAQLTPATTTPSTVSSRIDGDFEGWDGDTLFKLFNGQIWQQARYAYHYHYAYSPEVLIYSRGGQYYMKVDGVDDVLPVQRVK